MLSSDSRHFRVWASKVFFHTESRAGRLLLALLLIAMQNSYCSLAMCKLENSKLNAGDETSQILSLSSSCF